MLLQNQHPTCVIGHFGLYCRKDKSKVHKYTSLLIFSGKIKQQMILQWQCTLGLF